MQTKIELQKALAEQTQQHLDIAQRECDVVLHATHTADSLVGHSVRNQAMIYAGTAFLVIVTLMTVTAFQDKRSKTLAERQVGGVVAALEVAQANFKEAKVTDNQTPLAVSDKHKTQVAALNIAEYPQWGPPLLIADPNAVQLAAGFDPLVKDEQEDLLALGFDLGKADGFKGLQTKQALEEFVALYLPKSSRQLTDTQLAMVISSYASMARNDAARFGLAPGVVAAIRLSSVRTGVLFAYLMKLAAAESNFEPAVEAESSSATGLYQFTRDTWLMTIKRHGTRYGLGHYVKAIEFYVTRGGFQRPMVRDRAVRQHLLDLRKNPRLSAMMAAETVRDNHRKLSFLMSREPSQTDLYLTHFLGTNGAIAFLKALDKTPDAHALTMFPAAAKSNQGVFHSRAANPRTVDEVYELFGNKFSTTRYDDLALN